MPIATPEVYAQMLDTAKERGFAFPAINVSSSQTLNAALKGFADAGSDGIIQVSTGGAEYFSGPSVKNMVTGSVAFAAYAAEGLDVSVVLGSFDTPYQMSDGDRTHNLKVGAASLDGTVLMPHELFSFNEVVGPRTPEAGYRYATGIAAGQLVDTEGGGICQVSSTLFGAAFFAGLEIVRARPHSRPSSYVDMGLDSTVVYPDIDMKLRNPFDFPVVLHMTVSQGKVRAEVLGPRRPYQVAFERELKERLPYETVWRNDDRLRSGTESVAQRGMRGFKIERRRKLYQGGEVVATETWELSYPPTTEILRRGTNPAGEVPESKPATPLRDPAPQLRIVQ